MINTYNINNKKPAPENYGVGFFTSMCKVAGVLTVGVIIFAVALDIACSLASMLSSAMPVLLIVMGVSYLLAPMKGGVR